ncbi:Predicted oxidoreductase [Luteibacter sp. UNC138MFCol5.1]|uniref:aldo/keto reductase n=1 Tax=Luteibacter sp. UNC138MFCol5.1 TaxID=1502774 RepID=UPI0008BC04F7|nr:aldo/keto reductase [Luteibacter sp. UNC138MFCol5.1]SEO34450.1 Predicted oxidoreductase [Luteibacter sp. UNC138MFCol5.1]
MKYKQLGNTGLLVSRLCFGTMTFGGAGGVYEHIGNVDQAGADELVRACIDGGINFFDTADVYSAGESEKSLGQAFKNLGVPRTEVVLASKGYSRMGQGRNDVGASRGHLMDAVEASLKRLQTDHIDLYQIHATDVLTPIEETMRALDDMVTQGKVRYIGVSNWAAWRIAVANGIATTKDYARFETVQAYYSIAGRDLERELVPLMEYQKLGLLVWSPLAGGLLSGKFSRTNQNPEGSRRSAFDFPIVDKDRAWDVIEAMEPIARSRGCSIARIALAWLLSRNVVTSVIVGAKRLSQLEDNLSAVDIELTEAELASLSEASELPREYPGWMLETQGADRFGPVDLWAGKTR